MRLLQICSYYINDKFYFDFFFSLKKLQVSTQAYVFANQNKKNEFLNDKDTVVSYCFNTFDRLFFYIKHFKVWKDIKKKLGPFQYDCIHAHSLFSNGYIAYRIKMQTGTPYIVTVRYPDILTFFKWNVFLRPLGRKILSNADGVIFLSKSSMESIKTYLAPSFIFAMEKKTYIIPNGINDFWFENKLSHKKSFCKDGVLRLLFVGKINNNKNPDVLISICKILLARGILVELTIVGQMEQKKYKALFSSYDFIKYYPPCNKEALLNHYRNGDIFIMLSHKETFGLVYAEAMTQGLPVIYTKGQGFDKQFENGKVGYGCHSRNPEKAADAIENILSDYECISDRCVLLSSVFSWDKIGEKIVGVYTKTINDFRRKKL